VGKSEGVGWLVAGFNHGQDAFDEAAAQIDCVPCEERRQITG
jgi:hypothetical protein